MADYRTVLKNAFIDSVCLSCDTRTHEFTEEFDAKILKQFKKQQGPFYRYTSTPKRRIACIILAALLVLTSAACSVEEIREPAVEAIQNFFVNAREFLSGTKADKVSTLFPTDVTKIVGTSHISTTSKQYIIDEPEKIEGFLTLIGETNWVTPEFEIDYSSFNAYWSFDFLNTDGNSVLKLDMCNSRISNRAEVIITQNNTQKYFVISGRVYAKMLAFTNRTFYLHSSERPRPEAEYCNTLFERATSGLTEKEIKQIKKSIRNIHYEMEYLLAYNVSVLKDCDSVYWQYAISCEPFCDPVSGEERCFTSNKPIINDLKKIKSTLENKEMRTQIEKTLTLWENAMQSHDLEGLFTAHERIHDYDYFLFNYPTHYVYNENADYQGLDDYFGYLEQIK